MVFSELIRNQREVGEWGEVVQEFNGDVPFSLIRLAIDPIKLDNNWDNKSGWIELSAARHGSVTIPD